MHLHWVQAPVLQAPCRARALARVLVLRAHVRAVQILAPVVLKHANVVARMLVFVLQKHVTVLQVA